MKALFITAPENFRDEEYFMPKDILKSAGVEVVTASTKIGHLNGKLGGVTKSDITIGDVNYKDYDLATFIGGPGASVFFDNSTAHAIADNMLKDNKIVSAICIAPVTLARAGILKNKKATVFIDGKDDLTKNGAEYIETKTDVIIDGNIITAPGPEVAEKFGRILLKAIQK